MTDTTASMPPEPAAGPPPTPPPTPPPGPPAADGAAPSPFRWRLAHRPDVRFGHAAGGVAGILVVAAFVAFVVSVTGDDPTIPGVAFTGGLIVIALLAGWKVRGPVRSAAVAAVALAAPLFWAFAILGDSDGSRGDYRLVLLLSIATYVVFYLASWTRGRAVLLGLLLLFAAGWIVFEVGDQATPFVADVAGETQSDIVGDPADVLGSSGRSSDTAAAEMVIAVVLLGAGVVLDRRSRAGAATPCLLVGGLYGVVAALAWGGEADDVYATGVFLAIAGLAIGLAGSLGRRRGTSWIGAAVLLAGALTVIAQATSDAGGDGSDAVAWRFGAFALVGAGILLGAGALVAQWLAEPVDGGEPAPPAPPPAPAPVLAPDPTPPAPTPAEPPSDGPEPAG